MCLNDPGAVPVSCLCLVVARDPCEDLEDLGNEVGNVQTVSVWFI